VSRLSFSRRVPGRLRANRIAEARRRLAGEFVDLTVSNPTACGFACPPEVLVALADPAGASYNPDPRGLPAARAAISAFAGSPDPAVDPSQIVLTASTSEAYAFLFKLLCNPGEAVLVPAPSYPLLEHLARLEGVRAVTYHLREESGWSLDLHELSSAPAAVRAIVVVHPNNPTGSLVCPGDAQALEELCALRGWALIADEVFFPFPLEAQGRPVSFSGRRRVLTFTLGGLSKFAALPQFKAAWILVCGPPRQRHAALARLEFIADAYLSVATPVQHALPQLLRYGRQLSEQIGARCRHHLTVLRAGLSNLPALSVPPVEGGWSALVRIPDLGSEEECVLRLLEDFRVAVHPGYFFDFPRDGYLVVSLLPPPDTFEAGVARLADGLAAWLRET
jgi:hypothetical protein